MSSRQRQSQPHSTKQLHENDHHKQKQKRQKQNLYQSIKQLREQLSKPYYRVLLSGYMNDDEVKKQNINPEKYLRNTIVPYSKVLTGYLYIKGLFYLHLIEAVDLKLINNYLKSFYDLTLKEPNVHSQIRIVYQSYESSDQFFRTWECDYIPQAGPNLIQTDKTQQQISDRSYQIYQNIQDGAKRKKQNSSHKLSNMFLLSNDDMSILICKNLMSLEEYHNMYLNVQDIQKQGEKNYPLPPNIFNTIQFLQAQDYTAYK